MSKKIRSILSLVLVAAIFFAGGIYAKSATEKIEVKFDDIKVYKDNFLQELKDAEGKPVEPFIYNGTTYVPVRAAAELAGMKVDWDGASKSIKLWDKINPNTSYLMDVRPPHAGERYQAYIKDGETFTMGSMKYKKGMVLDCVSSLYKPASVFFNLNGEFSELEMTVGYIWGNEIIDSSKLQFYLDEKKVEEKDIKGGDVPFKLTLPVKGTLKLEIRSIPTDEGSSFIMGTKTGLGEIIAR